MEQQLENKSEKPIKKFIRKHKKSVIGTTICISTAAVLYIGTALYFTKHFYYGSEINGINISGKSVEQVNQLMNSELMKYSLTIKERGDKTEQIKAEEIGLTYNSGGDFKGFKDKQNPYKWISAFFNKESSKMMEGTQFDNSLLKDRIDKLSCFESSNIIEPKNAGLKYENNSYVIIDEILGNKVDKDILNSYVYEAISKEQATLDMGAIDCYIKPQYSSKSQKLIEARDLLNKYVAAKVTYTFGDKKEVIDGSTINKWISIDENFKITFDDSKPKEFVDNLSKTYDTKGKPRSFTTSSGNTINVGGGDYGWVINKIKETESLTAAVKEGQTIDKQPVYTQTAAVYGVNDIGNTYVEIDLTKQHMWFYKNGSLVTQGDVVTGNVSAKNTTPPGIYKLKYKEKNATLDGPDYSVPVSFWMPFNGGIGIHDASWRSAFGGKIYLTNGSHGCVNSPYNLAKAIFENIAPGTPVVCYN